MLLYVVHVVNIEFNDYGEVPGFAAFLCQNLKSSVFVRYQRGCKITVPQ